MLYSDDKRSGYWQWTWKKIKLNYSLVWLTHDFDDDLAIQFSSIGLQHENSLQ